MESSSSAPTTTKSSTSFSWQSMDQCAQRLEQSMRRSDETRRALQKAAIGSSSSSSSSSSKDFSPSFFVSTSPQFHEMEMERAQLYQWLSDRRQQQQQQQQQ
eukprot:CAMPEP_0168769744 /NCGR_PEP_ID=MMETSP0725-20121227/2559_1 /TAXON_ID=265536 /ORGANISM="Amphiprora sp., Strain CCMP467" /LENGTH=101 /DNA_ID=CAMNT_0008819161 /DNA_START=118 /DNA_END=423 /DNA_ORIENTATION=-